MIFFMMPDLVDKRAKDIEDELPGSLEKSFGKCYTSG